MIRASAFLQGPRAPPDLNRRPWGSRPVCVSHRQRLDRDLLPAAQASGVVGRWCWTFGSGSSSHTCAGEHRAGERIRGNCFGTCRHPTPDSCHKPGSQLWGSPPPRISGHDIQDPELQVDIQAEPEAPPCSQVSLRLLLGCSSSLRRSWARRGMGRA